MTDPEIDLKLNLSDVTRLHDVLCVVEDRDSREEQIRAYLALIIATEQKRVLLSGRGSVGTHLARGV